MQKNIKNHNVMKLFYLLLLSAISPAQSEYISQIKVVDACTHLAEPVKIDAFGIKGTRLKTSDDISRAVEACQKSLTENSDDPHIKFTGWAVSSSYPYCSNHTH